MSHTSTNHGPRAITDLHVPEALLQWEPSPHPLVSVYVDWQASGRGLHEARTLIRKQLHEAEALLLQHTEARASFLADSERIRGYLDHDAPPEARGIALFACHGRGFWHVSPFAVPLPTRAHAGDYALLMPFAEATQDAPRALVVVADAAHVRLIALEVGAVRELPAFETHTWDAARIDSRTGWRSGHRQHALETEQRRHAQRVAELIRHTIAEDGYARLALAGEREVTAQIALALSDDMRERVATVEAIDMRATADAVAAHVWPHVATAARAEREAEADALVSRAAGALDAIADPAAVRERLASGLVDTLALDPGRLDEPAAELLLREALTHRSRVLIVRGHAGLAPTGLVASIR